MRLNDLDVRTDSKVADGVYYLVLVHPKGCIEKGHYRLFADAQRDASGMPRVRGWLGESDGVTRLACGRARVFTDALGRQRARGLGGAGDADPVPGGA